MPISEQEKAEIKGEVKAEIRKEDWRAVFLVLGAFAILFGVVYVIPDPLWGGVAAGLGILVFMMIAGSRIK